MAITSPACTLPLLREQIKRLIEDQGCRGFYNPSPIMVTPSSAPYMRVMLHRFNVKKFPRQKRRKGGYRSISQDDALYRKRMNMLRQMQNEEDSP